ncbi:hypothetical protein BpHYR1_044383 [Brachionus plicatilis]|uniref:Transmembrane protein n=1 Tax=Brachionus plicatilis TaxID=10195 RepID=A0A3M7SVY2_BRAPC|nr:hypothetical protein BpHYR1_044383 [Brachionus plicatilis]
MNLSKEKNSLKLIRLKIYINFLPFIAVFFNFVNQLSLSFLYLEKTTEHDFSTDIFIFHLISHCSSSLRYLSGGLSSNTHRPTFLLAKRTTSHHSDSSCFGLLAGIILKNSMIIVYQIRSNDLTRLVLILSQTFFSDFSSQELFIAFNKLKIDDILSKS